MSSPAVERPGISDPFYSLVPNGTSSVGPGAPVVRYLGGSTATATVLRVVWPQPPLTPVERPRPVARTAQEMLLWLRQETGLTWEQFGTVFGVSRRAAHLWASGARLNARNERVVQEFTELVAALDATSPEQRRAVLFALGPAGRSLLDGFRARNAVDDAAVTGRPFRPQDLLGNQHGDVSRR